MVISAVRPQVVNCEFQIETVPLPAWIHCLKTKGFYRIQKVNPSLWFIWVYESLKPILKNMVTLEGAGECTGFESMGQAFGPICVSISRMKYACMIGISYSFFFWKFYVWRGALMYNLIKSLILLLRKHKEAWERDLRIILDFLRESKYTLAGGDLQSSISPILHRHLWSCLCFLSKDSRYLS